MNVLISKAGIAGPTLCCDRWGGGRAGTGSQLHSTLRAAWLPPRRACREGRKEADDPLPDAL